MESKHMENTRSTLEDPSSKDDSDCFRDSYATSLPCRRPYKLNILKENLLYKFEEEYEVDKPELVQVYLRLKPSGMLNAAYEIRSDKCLVTSMDTGTVGHGRRTQQIVKKMYTFSHIFGSDSHQKEVFETVVKTNLHRLSEGHNYTLLTYGASGSGKTYTLMGTKSAPGLIPRSLEYLFHIVEASQMPNYRPCDNGVEKLSTIQQYQELMWVDKLRQVSAPARKKYRRMSANLMVEFSASTLNLSNRTCYYIWVSFIEIYNEVVYDLLVPPESRMKLYIMSDSNGQEYVKGAKQAFVRSGEEAHDVLVAGSHNLRVASTGVNAHSSRSHCIFTITMITETTDGVRVSRMRLCDLAGSERANRTQNKGARMAESGAINSSLHVLERCLRMLRKNQRQRQPDGGFIPFRQSKLTRLLCSGLSGSCGEFFGLVVTLSQELDCMPESKRVLQVTAVAKDIQINNTVIESTLESTGSHLQDTYDLKEIEKLRSENERLCFELAQRDIEAKELRALLEKRRLESVERMQRLVKEAKDMTQEYHVAIADSLKQRHAEEIDTIKQNSAAEIRQLQSENTHLLTENAKLREQLAAEKVSRTIDLEELQHLRRVIEETEEKQSGRATPILKDYELMMSESDEDESDDCLGDVKPFQNTTTHSLCEENLQKSMDDEIGDVDAQISTDNISMMSDNDVVINVDSDDDKTAGEHTNNSDVDREFVVVNSCRAENVKDVSYLQNTNTSSAKNSERNSNSVRLIKNISLPSSEDSNQLLQCTFSEQGQLKKDCILPSEFSIAIPNYDDRNRSPVILQNESQKSTIVRANDDLVNADSFALEQLRNSVKSSDIKNDVSNEIAHFGIAKAMELRYESADNVIVSDAKEILVSSREIISNDDLHHALSQNKTISLVGTKVGSVTSKVEDTTVTVEGDDRSPRLKEMEELKNDNSVTSITHSKKPASPMKLFGLLKNNRDSLPESIHMMSPKTEITKSSGTPRYSILNSSLAQFERFENALDDKRCRENADNFFIGFREPPTTGGEKKIYFNNLDTVSANSVNLETGVASEDVEKNYERNVPVKESNIHNISDIEIKINSSNIAVSKDHCFVKSKLITNSNKHHSVDIFEEVSSPAFKCKTVSDERKEEKGDVEQESNCKLNVENQPDKINATEPLLKSDINIEEISITKKNTLGNNTTEEFENLYRDVSTSNVSEFNALLTHENVNIKAVSEDSHTKHNDNVRIGNDIVGNFRTDTINDVSSKVLNTTLDLDEMEKENEGAKRDKYNLRSKSQKKKRTNGPKYNLRLRKQQNLCFEAEAEDKNKLQEIANLQKQFSDVTLNIPVNVKPVNDVVSLTRESQEKENIPLETQSCPQKSVTRNRRNLYTPREPLEDSFSAGESDEQVKIPRPSYHRGRSRRRL